MRGADGQPLAAALPAAATDTPQHQALRYRVHGWIKGLEYHAQAELSWHTEDGRYLARQSISAFLLGSLEQTSRGRIGAEGFQPERFDDRRLTRLRSATLDWEAQLARFEPERPPAAIGPGTIPVMALTMPIAMALAAETGISPVLLAPITVLGSAAGGISPIAPTGIIGITLSAAQGIKGIDMPYFYNSLMAETIWAAILYLALGGHKLKTEKVLKQSDLPPFNRDQWITMAGVIAMVLIVLVTKANVGLIAFLIGVILLLLKVADERKSISCIPWGTLILVCGVGVLMNLAIKLKGIELLAKFLSTLMTESTASFIIGLTAGIMSWFSSTSGVVMPTLIPTVSSLQAAVGNVSALDLVSAITMSAHTAGTSPASTGGALAMAAYAANAHITPEQQNKLFIQMFIVAACGVFVVSALAGLGLYRIWGL